MSALATVGHNQPPSLIDFIHEAVSDLRRFLADTPVIQDGATAQQGALFLERCRKNLQDLEDARKAETGPLNEQVKAINEHYKTARSPLESTLNILRARLTDFAAREEARRFHEAEAKRKEAELAELEARVAEQKERDAKANASFGEIVDVAEKVIEADQAFAAAQKADRAAATAERNTTVRLSSQLGGRAVSMRTKETLVLDDACEAIKAMGVTNNIRDAILTAARDFRKRNDTLPAGVSSVTTREI